MSTPVGNMWRKPHSETPLERKKSLLNSMSLIYSQRYIVLRSFTVYLASLLMCIQIRVLQQLTQWTMGNPDRIRERMEEQKDSEQTIWVC